jgi:hypothetical protein
VREINKSRGRKRDKRMENRRKINRKTKEIIRKRRMEKLLSKWIVQVKNRKNLKL